ncbi:hypothetical protein R6Q59_005808 [Mikania micrantha]
MRRNQNKSNNDKHDNGNGLIPNSFRFISSCIKTVSTNVRSAGASVSGSVSGDSCDELRKDQVSLVSEHVVAQDAGAKAADFDDDDGGGLALNAQSRAMLMVKLDRSGITQVCKDLIFMYVLQDDPEFDLDIKDDVEKSVPRTVPVVYLRFDRWRERTSSTVDA